MSLSRPGEVPNGQRLILTGLGFCHGSKIKGQRQGSLEFIQEVIAIVDLSGSGGNGGQEESERH